jgi:hypothetical protein
MSAAMRQNRLPAARFRFKPRSTINLTHPHCNMHIGFAENPHGQTHRIPTGWGARNVCASLKFHGPDALSP